MSTMYCHKAIGSITVDNYPAPEERRPRGLIMKKEYWINKEIAIDMLKKMPEKRKNTFRKALDRNMYLTSAWVLTLGRMTIYKEGYYLQLYGTRSSFSVWAYDNDGRFIFSRKPLDKKLRKLYIVDIMFNEVDFIGY